MAVIVDVKETLDKFYLSYSRYSLYMGNSLQNDISSDGLSLKMTQWLSPILYKLGLTGDMWSLNRIVRKMAHVFEFAVLGGCLYVALHQFNREYAGLKVIFIGLVIAVMDECLQLASIGRHASIRDVAIDTAGVIIGVAVVQVILSIYRRIRHS